MKERARTEKKNGNPTQTYGHEVQLLTPMAQSRPHDTLRTHKITSYHLMEVQNKALTNLKHTMLFSYTDDCHCAFDLNTPRPASVTQGLQEYIIHTKCSLGTLNKEVEVHD